MRFYKWELVGYLWLAYFLNQADRQIYNVLLPDIRADMGLTDIQCGLVVTAFMITYGILVPIAGFLGDYISRKWIVCGSILFWSVATVLTGLSSAFIGLVMFRSLATGAGEAFYYPAANSMISQYHSQKSRATAMGIHQSSLYIGMIASSVISGWIASQWGWRCAFVIFGSFGMLTALIMFWRLRNDWLDRRLEAANGSGEGEACNGEGCNDEGSDDALNTQATSAEINPRDASLTEVETFSFVRTLGEIFSRPTILGLWVGFGAFNFVGLAFYTWMPAFLQETYKLNQVEAGFNATFYHLVLAVLGVLFGGWLSDVLSERRHGIRIELEGYSLLLCAPFVYLLATADSMYMCIVGMGLFGFARGIYDSNLFAALFDYIPPQIRASASGLMLSVAMIVSAIGPVILAMLKESFGFRQAMASMSIVVAVGGLVILLVMACFARRDYYQE